MEQSNESILELKNISKNFDNFAAISSVNLSIFKGEFITLLGPSGSGKTTLLQMIAGFTQPTEGNIVLFGKDISSLPSNKRNMGFVFQDYALFPHMNVFQNIAYPLKVRKKSKAEIEKQVEETMDLVQLKDFRHRKPSELSGGQQQRVALARALVFKPNLILMDEPLGALDKKLRDYFQLEIKKIQSITGITIIFVTHDQEEALVMSDRIAVMNKSKLVQLDTPTQLYENPKNYFVADFIGENNFIKGIITKVLHEKIIVKIGKTGKMITVTNTCKDPKINQPIYISIRPKKIKITKKEYNHQMKNCTSLVGRIKSKVYLGDHFKYIVKVKDMNETFHLTVVTQYNDNWSTGEDVTVHLENDQLQILERK